MLNKKIIFLIILLLTLGMVTGVVFLYSQKEISIKNQAANIIQEEIRPISLVFVGDMMFDRSVEKLIDENGATYPFEKISDFLKQADLAIGNLEGPIVKKTIQFPRSSLKFAFSEKTVGGLNFAGFDLLNLANNHTQNMGQDGLKETRETLKSANMDSFGDPLVCSKDFLFKKDNLIFLGFNKTFPSTCPDEDILNAIKEIKLSNPESFLIINIHWGSEYQLKNSKQQQELAYKIIDNGADLIIGHHPHVVQNIEKYKNKMIFYSLGNFVFDQYFSVETQKGMVVNLEIYPDKFIYKTFFVSITDSQPKIAESGEIIEIKK
jgi:poly-gamma-glutamate synthesis protein (capsule biosynthesis protein)